MVFPQTSVSIRFLEREAGALPKSSSFDAPPQHNHLFFCPPPFGGSHPPPKKKSFWHLFLLAAFSPFPHIFCCCRIFFKKRRKTKWFSHLFASSYQVPCIFCIILQKKGVLKKLYAKKRKENLKTNLLQKRFFPKDLYLATLRCYIKLTV